jgi:glycosyltransferase involved in cell wall biosynthesis
MRRKNTVYLFTSAFPYGTRSETFLETEILYLSEAFNQVYVIPAQKDGETQRTLPTNVHLLNWIVDEKPHKGSELLFRHAFSIVRLFFFMFRSSSVNRRFYLRHFRYFLGNLLGELDYYERLKPHLQTVDKSTSLFYTYWFVHSLLSLSLLKEEGHISHLVSRAHGFDLYDNRNQGRPMPFREYKLQHINTVYCISKKGQDYIKNKTDKRYHAKIELAYLGVRKPNSIPTAPIHSIPLLISVANLIPLKRIDLIIESLKAHEKPIRWIHFGDGPLFDSLNYKIQSLPTHIEAKLMGQFKNEDILRFYDNNYVDLFVSLSESEGLPVSMMEAQSYGIPILSCNVGGISEIVQNEKTGILLPVNIKPENISIEIQRALDSSFNNLMIRDYFDKNFDASHNYRLFCQKISRTL